MSKKTEPFTAIANTASDKNDAVTSQLFESTRARLASDFHIDSMFVGVPKLSRVLGLAPSTINGHIRAGSFFLPYRKFGTMTVVSLDDLTRWYCSSENVVQITTASQEQSAAPDPVCEPMQSHEQWKAELGERALREVAARKRMRELQEQARLSGR